MRLLRPAARTVLAGLVILLCFTPAVFAETETETQTQTFTTATYSAGYLRLAMVSAAPAGYPQGSGSAELQTEGDLVSVHFQAEGMAQSVHLTLFLVANGTTHSVANMTTSLDGDVEGEATVNLSPGSYSVGLSVLDTSSFGSPTQVMTSSPATASLVVVQGSQTSQTTVETTQTVSTYSGGETEDDGIRTAIQNRVIPAVVDVGEQGSTVAVSDANFSVSVGGYQDGYLVSISAANVTGPRVLLINLTSSHARGVFSGPVLITLDGAAIQQGATFSEVLGAKAGDPARFVLISDPSALSLLISIPHFSYHTIAILPILLQAGAVLLVYLPAVLFAAAAVTAIVVSVYSRRTRADV